MTCAYESVDSMTLKPKIDYDRDDVIMIEQDGSGHTLAQPTKLFIVKSVEQFELPWRVEMDDETPDYCEVTCLHFESLRALSVCTRLNLKGHVTRAACSRLDKSVS